MDDPREGSSEGAEAWRSGTEEESEAVRLALGGGILDLLESESSRDREAAVSALLGVARASVDVVVPVLPKLARVIDDLDLERQIDVSELFRIASGERPDSVPDDAVEELLALYGRDMDYWQDDLELASQVLHIGVSIGSNLESPALRAACHERLGDMERRRGDLVKAESHYEESLGIARATGDVEGEASNRNNLGVVAQERGDLDRAESYYEESLELEREVGNPSGEASNLNNLGVVAQKRGDVEAAEQFHEESLAIKRDIGDRSGEVSSLNNLGMVAQKRGDVATAQGYHEEALETAREIGDRTNEALSLGNLGSLSASVGDYATATDRLSGAFELFVATGSIKDAVGIADYLAWIAEERDDPEAALEWCERGLDLADRSAADLSDAVEGLRTRREAVVDTE